MIAVDWTGLGLGAAAGVVMSALFFAGLAFGMKRALRTDRAVGLLALSATLRIAAFLGVGWVVVAQAGPWAFAGYGLAFIVSRRIATGLARAPVRAGGPE
jgi:hypothetical protein